MFTKETIDFSALNEEEIKEKLKEYRISLTISEILKIQNEILKRPPSVAECILWSIQGSEHSSYKSSKPFLKQLPTQAPNVLLGPCEDAGIVEIARDNEGNKYGIVISHESHNHPSQIVPYEGAATGIGGNVRDVCCMGAKVIAVADALRFGEINGPDRKINNKSKWIHRGVVSGIAGYGNPIGVPNIGGDVFYDESYNDNCLVNVLTLGVLREDEIIHSKAPKEAGGYDLILVGKPTDNSGFGGASFASLELKEEEKEQNKGAVQEPNAFLKRHLLKSTYTLFKILKEKNLLDKVGFKDLGAGGIACASVELADAGGYGAEVDLDKVHIGMEGLHPSVLLCSETQERFMWVCNPSITDLIVSHYNKTFDLPKISKGAKASVVGKIRDDGQYVVKYHGEEIVNAKANQVTEGLLYNRAYRKEKIKHTEPPVEKKKNYDDILLGLLSDENIASREPIFEQYDKQVQGITLSEAGQNDSGVLQPFKEEKYPDEIKKIGVSLSVGHNPAYGKIDAYWCAVNAVLEAMANCVAVNAKPQAITDCLCFGNPEKPEQMNDFVEGVKGVSEACRQIHLKDHQDSPTPIVSGNVSLYNESNGKSIAPSPIIGCLGKIDDISKIVNKNFKLSESIILMVGERKDELGGSAFYQLHDELGANVPKPNLKEKEKEFYAVLESMDDNLVLSCHDISNGGIAIALAEMCFKNNIGCKINLEGKMEEYKKLFSETSGFILEVRPENLEKIKMIFEKNNAKVFEIGKTVDNGLISINESVNLEIKKAKQAWQNGLREKL